MGARWIATAVVTLAVCACTGLASAATRISNPRAPHPTFDQPDSLLVRKSEFGLLLGTPGLFNLEAGYWPHPIWGVRASGLYFGTSFVAMQGNVCRTLGRKGRVRHALALVAGYMQRGGNEEWTYAGLAWDANWGPLYTELGQVIGRGDFFTDREKVQAGILVQIGVMGGGGVIGPR